jgi:hypothetical protein
MAMGIGCGKTRYRDEHAFIGQFCQPLRSRQTTSTIKENNDEPYR